MVKYFHCIVYFNEKENIISFNPQHNFLRFAYYLPFVDKETEAQKE